MGSAGWVTATVDSAPEGSICTSAYPLSGNAVPDPSTYSDPSFPGAINGASRGELAGRPGSGDVPSRRPAGGRRHTTGADLWDPSAQRLPSAARVTSDGEAPPPRLIV